MSPAVTLLAVGTGTCSSGGNSSGVVRLQETTRCQSAAADSGPNGSRSGREAKNAHLWQLCQVLPSTIAHSITQCCRSFTLREANATVDSSTWMEQARVGNHNLVIACDFCWSISTYCSVPQHHVGVTEATGEAGA